MTIWQQNYSWLLEAPPPIEADERLAILAMLAGAVDRWLDRVHVMGDPDAQASAVWALAQFDAFARYVPDDDWPVPAIRRAVRRLRGLE